MGNSGSGTILLLCCFHRKGLISLSLLYEYTVQILEKNLDLPKQGRRECGPAGLMAMHGLASKLHVVCVNVGFKPQAKYFSSSLMPCSVNKKTLTYVLVFHTAFL